MEPLACNWSEKISLWILTWKKTIKFGSQIPTIFGCYQLFQTWYLKVLIKIKLYTSYNVLLICTGTFIFRVIYQVYIFLLKHVHVQGISLGWTLNNKKVGDRDIYVNGHIYFNISCELVGTYILVSNDL
jgi:hypothetical protein